VSPFFENDAPTKILSKVLLESQKTLIRRFRHHWGGSRRDVKRRKPWCGAKGRHAQLMWMNPRARFTVAERRSKFDPLSPNNYVFSTRAQP
jgi:hypothetical protein